MASILGKIAANFETTLATKAANAATTATLASVTDKDGVAIPNGTYFFTINQGKTNEEHIKCTLTGTALSAIQHVSRQGTFTSGISATNGHRAGSSVKLTDFANLKLITDILNGTANLDGSSPMKYDAEPSAHTERKQLAEIGFVQDTAIAGGADASTTVKGISKMSVAPASATNPIAVGDNDGRVPSQGENDALVGTVGTPSSTNKFVTNDDTATTGANKVLRLNGSGKLAAGVENIKFGGTGADGALSISSGTTTVDLAGAQVVIKNYTSISITGTGKLAFINPHANGTIIILKSQGNVTLTSSNNPLIDITGLGSTASILGNGTIRETPATALTPTAPTAGTGGSSVGLSKINSYKSVKVWCGAGGATGGNSNPAGGIGGTGGRGAGALIIEVGGAFNCTGTINAAGTVGANGAGSGSGYSGGGGGGGGSYVAGVNGTDGANIGGGAQGGGGGGGGGGVVLVIYNTLTADSGTYTITGGAGGTSGNGGTGGTGGDGASLVISNTEFV